ncbi:4'-phosphopantetheinyl transferase family protein [Pedobacter nyackensis]|uniref:4'-phosphopantetheinyl transferase superfamily protein n=1 Tax=Pedobacter nyackensis TaxID=475255 RepID=A0A1W2EWV6_9SPHI|nr:4'-phosphopantetheinyl transferase superfamily protein [Pedobacter nyackensis]SMD14161.1 4'-phosphopantetheinyl transferase superfamily protein [Pedobacter nyackensis]
MIGNDIVDLSIAAKESNWARTGYLEKIFTTAERFHIQVAKDPQIMVWLMWTMKEAAYKAYSRETKFRTFAPTLICCNNLILHDETASGDLFYEGKVFYSQSSIAQNYIHTIASEKASVLKDINPKISDYNEFDNSYRSTHPASVSHHGHYLALIYL